MTVTSTSRAPRPRFAKVVASLLSLNVLVTGLTLISSPLQARALGPSGRGDLAAIMVSLGFAQLILSLGLPAYVMRQSSREDKPLGTMLGSTGALAVALGLLCTAAAYPLSAFVAEGRETVRLFVLIGFAIMPITLVIGLLDAVRWGQQRWRLYVYTRLIPAVGGTAAVVVMYVTDTLTVGSMAAVVMILGLLAAVPLLGVVRHGRPFHFARPVAREGLIFGVKAWAGRLTNVANQRLDQVVMIKFVTSRELGFYVMAVTIAGLTNVVAAATVGAVSPRVAAGDHGFAARATRVTLASITLTSAALLVTVPFLVPLLFGSDFKPVVPMAQILLVAAIPLAGTGILAEMLSAAGHPGVASRGELIAAVVTVAGLLFLLGPLGGEGAAITSVAAYSVSFAYILRQAARRLSGRKRDYLIPTPSDINWFRALLVRRP
jgi:O-antigen/teichoic acid export membrane protein